MTDFCVCTNCEVGFYPKKLDRVKFCSRECYFYYQNKNSYPDDVWTKKRLCKITYKTCVVCDGLFVSHRKTDVACLSVLCREAYKERIRIARRIEFRTDIDRSARTCPVCDMEFTPPYGHAARVYCSRVCLRKHGHMVGKAKRRARVRSLPYEPVDPFVVFKKYKWRCAICKCATPRELRGTTQPNAPELDHIVPLALGGAHTYANTQCACRECNQDKGITIMTITNNNVIETSSVHG
jgi:5-methylcytosine-specific restriction endonuclease McrA